MTKQFIVIDTNSELDPVRYPIDTDEQVTKARKALREAGLDYEDVWVGEPDDEDAYRTEGKLFALDPGVATKAYVDAVSEGQVEIVLNVYRDPSPGRMTAQRALAEAQEHEDTAALLEKAGNLDDAAFEMAHADELRIYAQSLKVPS